MKHWIAVLLVLSLLAACQRGKDRSQSTTVALVVKTINNPFFIDMEQGAQEAAKRLGLQLIVQGADRELDVEKQMQIIENLIETKVSALCITPSGSREIVPAILKANKAGIPVLILDTRVDETVLKESEGSVLTYIGSDNFEGGKLAGEFIVEKLQGGGNVAILEGIPGHETGDSRLKGFHSIMDKSPRIKIVSSQTANWERDQGYNVFQNILQSHPEVDALFACNDMMALGAIEAIAAAKKTGKIIVVGFDAIVDAKDAIRLGRMAATVAQYPDEMGRVAVESVSKVLKGESIPTYIPVKIRLVTKVTLQSENTHNN